MYRAANAILRLTVEGRICLTLRPPDMEEGKMVGNYRDLFDTLMKYVCHLQTRFEELFSVRSIKNQFQSNKYITCNKSSPDSHLKSRV